MLLTQCQYMPHLTLLQIDHVRCTKFQAEQKPCHNGHTAKARAGSKLWSHHCKHQVYQEVPARYHMHGLFMASLVVQNQNISSAFKQPCPWTPACRLFKQLPLAS